MWLSHALDYNRGLYRVFHKQESGAISLIGYAALLCRECNSLQDDARGDVVASYKLSSHHVRGRWRQGAGFVLLAIVFVLPFE